MSISNLIGVPTGVITGNDVKKLFDYAKAHNFAIPAVNCTSSSTINACLETAKATSSPIIVQVSNGGCAFYAGKGLSNKDQKAAIVGAIAAGLHVRAVAKHYGIPVVLHSDHCAKKLLPWFDGMVKADEEYFAKHGEPLYSSHMLDLSEEPHPENIKICEHYLKRLSKVNGFLEMELGITGGEEDGVDNSNVDSSKFYTQPDEVWAVYKALAAISPNFSIASAFGNVHGVYKPGNVQLRPENLGKAQEYISKKLGLAPGSKPATFVFHGGSGSEKDKIATALGHGVVKMNIDTDTQWAYWDGVRKFEAKNRAYLQGQLGNPKGADKPNKKFYDPRVWIRKGEESFKARLVEAYTDLKSLGTLGAPKAKL
jgi:fructose-bisphosphate aldolase class II